MANTSHIRFTPRVQEVCTKHGLWRGDQPQGALAALLMGAKRLVAPQTGHLYYECDTSQVDMLLAFADALHCSLTAAGLSQADGAALAQWRRRIREASGRAAPAWRPHPAPATARPPTSRTATVQLFGLPPTEPAAKAAYQQHVIKTLRDLVDFSQSSAY